MPTATERRVLQQPTLPCECINSHKDSGTGVITFWYCTGRTTFGGSIILYRRRVYAICDECNLNGHMSTDPFYTKALLAWIDTQVAPPANYVG